MIKKVTITGADDNTDPKALFELSRAYPFVEWGILRSQRQEGRPRYPSNDWMFAFKMEHMSLSNRSIQRPSIQVSIHLCGSWVREFLEGNMFPARFLGELYQRVQINTHGELHRVTEDFITLVKSMPETEFIMQVDGLMNEFIQRSVGNFRVAALFDLSSGAGILPDHWPKPLHGIHCGYAGGLSPENVVDQIRSIEVIAGDSPTWIDVETHVRSVIDGKDVLDMSKVETFLRRSAPFVHA